MAKKLAWTESQVFSALQRLFKPPAFVVLPQVRNGTGWSKTARTADAVVASVWPSRGLFLMGVEIKRTLADWRRELAHPEKSDDIGRFCSYWYIAAPKGVVPEAELPEGWGLIECTGNSTRIARKAIERDASPPDVPFVAAVMRKLSEVTVPISEVKTRIDNAVAELRESGVREYRVLREAVDQFEADSGMKISDAAAWDRIGQQVKFVRESGITDCLSRARRLRTEAQRIVSGLDEAMKAIGNH